MFWMRNGWSRTDSLRLDCEWWDSCKCEWRFCSLSLLHLSPIIREIFLILLLSVFSFCFGCFFFSFFNTRAVAVWCSCCLARSAIGLFLFVEMIELTKWLSKWNVIWAHSSSEKCWTLNARVRTWAKPSRFDWKSVDVHGFLLVILLMCACLGSDTSLPRYALLCAMFCACSRMRTHAHHTNPDTLTIDSRRIESAVMILCDMCKSHVVYICNFCQFCVLSLACMCCV